jgi:hypothetical protein
LHLLKPFLFFLFEEYGLSSPVWSNQDKCHQKEDTYIAHHRSSAFHKPVEHQRAVEHIDVIVGTSHAIKRVPNPQIMWCQPQE